MSSSRSTLERIGARVPVPQPAYERLMRRHDRKRRNRRIGTIVLALAIAVLAIGGSLRALHRSVAPQPANPNLDHSFGVNGLVTTSIGAEGDVIHAITIQPDGKIVAVGSSGSAAEWALARYNTDGSLDPTFGDGGVVTTDFTPADDEAQAVAIQPDGKIVVTGSADTFSMFAVARYNADGTLDQTFGTGGKVTTDFTPGHADFARNVVIQPDGKIVAGGRSNNAGASDFALVRYNADGSLDTTFGNGGKVATNFHASDDDWGLAIQPDGKLVAAGAGGATPLGHYAFAMARYRPDGSLDPSFGTRGQVAEVAGASFDVVLQPDGKILMEGTGGSSTPTPNSGLTLVRYNADGTLDRSFGKNGVVISTSIPWQAASRLALEPDGKIVVAGGERPAPAFDVARFNPDGTPDRTFGTNGEISIDFGAAYSSSEASQVATEPDGGIVVAGFAARSASDSDFALARIGPGTAVTRTSSSSHEESFPWYVGLAALVGLAVFVWFRRRAV